MLTGKFLLPLIVALLSTLPAFGKTDKVKICIPVFREEFLTLSVIEAVDKGFFKKEGIDAQIVVSPDFKYGWTKGPNDISIPRSILSDQGSSDRIAKAGGCQFGASVIEKFMFDDKARGPVKPLFVSLYGRDYDTHLIVGRNSNIKSVQDLKGKRIRMGQLPTYIALGNILKEAGLTLKDVEPVIQVEPADVLAKLQNGEIDAAMTYVPTMSYMMATGQVRILKENIVKNYILPTVPHSLIVANRVVAEKSPDLVNRFMSAIQKATGHIERNPSEAIYALKRNSKKLFSKEWITDPVTTEKASVFIGPLNVVSLVENSPARDEAVKAVAAYGNLIDQIGYGSNLTNLKSWLTEERPVQKVGSL